MMGVNQTGKKPSDLLDRVGRVDLDLVPPVGYDEIHIATPKALTDTGFKLPKHIEIERFDLVFQDMGIESDPVDAWVTNRINLLAETKFVKSTHNLPENFNYADMIKSYFEYLEYVKEKEKREGL